MLILRKNLPKDPFFFFSPSFDSARYGHYGVTSNGLTWSLLPFNSTGSSFNRYAAVGMMLSLEERTAVGQTVRTATMSTMTCSADVIKSDIPTAPGSTKTVSMESVVVVGAVQESPQTFATISIQIFGGTGVLTSNGQNINVEYVVAVRFEAKND
jgi:hypothetical protein